MSDLVGNPEDGFSHKEALIYLYVSFSRLITSVGVERAVISAIVVS